MDENKLVFAKILGEIYRTQKRIDKNLCNVSDARIYGLLNGVQRVVNEELENMNFVSENHERFMVGVLNEYFTDPNKLQNLKGYYDIEDELESVGIDRSTAITILTLLQEEGRFTNVIAKFNSSGSPVECKTFEIEDYEK